MVDASDKMPIFLHTQRCILCFPSHHSLNSWFVSGYLVFLWDSKQKFPVKMPHYSWRRSRPSSGTSSESPVPSILKKGNRSSGSSVENFSGCSSDETNKQTNSDNKRSPSPAFIQTQQPQHTVVNLTKIKIYWASVLLIVMLNLILMYLIY